MTSKVKQQQLVCECCKHKWVPQDPVNKPAVCPKCKSPYWDRERAVRTVKELRDREIEVRLAEDIK
jgi:Zn finger protein HypA/HybF involved in hydrogenase expression